MGNYWDDTAEAVQEKAVQAEPKIENLLTILGDIDQNIRINLKERRRVSAQIQDLLNNHSAKFTDMNTNMEDLLSGRVEIPDERASRAPF